MTGLRARLSDDRGSMPMLLMVTIVGLLLSAMLVPLLVTQDRATRFGTSRVHALDAAQAGIDATLGQIRAAVDGTGIGDSSRLPCGPISGSVDSAGDGAYTVGVEYFTADPVANPTAAKMLCALGYGTYDAASGAFTPSYARITSTGTDGRAVNGSSGGRTLLTTYVFKTSNTNVPGGVLRIYPAAGNTTALCVDAATSTPSAGASVTLQTCSTATPPASQQVFAYRTDLTIQLLSSVTPTYPNGLCLDTAGPTAGNPVVLNACRALGSPNYTQQWSFDDWGAYRASLSGSRTNGTLATVCINVAAQSAGQQLTLAACAQNTSSPTQAWVPAPSVGAGAAAPPQLINYLEFGRCLDVTGQNVNADHLIDYPCKQNPWAGAVAWNQKFTTPAIAAGANSAAGQLVTTTSSTNYCLTTPGTAGGYVTVKTCGSTAASLQRWTVYNGDKSLPYATKFTIVDSSELCLALTQPVTGEQWSAIDVEKCTGAAEQKWNANPNLSVPTLQNTLER
ncbi:MAG TPA: ricin-type beta-trefoil lectin domain protein [Jatrophihabitantaceae bacterium]|jgi:hypothetical protein